MDIFNETPIKWDSAVTHKFKADKKFNGKS